MVAFCTSMEGEEKGDLILSCLRKFFFAPELFFSSHISTFPVLRKSEREKKVFPLFILNFCFLLFRRGGKKNLRGNLLYASSSYPTTTAAVFSAFGLRLRQAGMLDASRDQQRKILVFPWEKSSTILQYT